MATVLADEDLLYQVPLTYRGAPLAGGRGLVATAEHSVLGTRWIHDGERDPVWASELLRLVRTGGVSEPSRKRGVGPAEARGRALAPFGRLVTYGIASGEPNTVVSGALMGRSHAVVGFWLVHCLRKPQEMVAEPLRDLFARVAAGELKVVEGEVYPLSDVRRAHADLQARRTMGKVLLDPAS